MGEDRSNSKPRAVTAPRDAVGHALTNRRQKLGKTYRDLAALAKQVAENDPEQFEKVSHTQFNLAELQGIQFFEGSSNRKKIKTILQVLYGGDIDLFVQETGVIPDIIGYVRTTPIGDDVPQVFLYEEGQIVSLNEITDGKHARGNHNLQMPTSHFALKLKSNAMSPTVFAGQTIGVRSTSQAQRGSMAVIRRGTQGLVVAWHLGNNVFAQNNPEDGQPSFSLTGSDAVIGVVSWIVPQLGGQNV